MEGMEEVQGNLQGYFPGFSANIPPNFPECSHTLDSYSPLFLQCDEWIP